MTCFMQNTQKLNMLGCTVQSVEIFKTYSRGFEKFSMEGAYSKCQLFATKVHYINILEIHFDSGNEKIAKENQVVREV